MELQLPLTNLGIKKQSLVNHKGVEYSLADSPGGFHLVVLSPPDSPSIEAFSGDVSEFNHQSLLVGPLNPHNAASLRQQLPWLRPSLIGLNTSAGMGDRIGIATPGHVRAVSEFRRRIRPIFAQQSIREMNRTGRTPQQVLDDVTWGVFETGWQGGMGADADHLKTTKDIDACLEAGYTFFTIDPGEHVDNQADTDSFSTLIEKATLLPTGMQLKNTGLLGKIFDIEGRKILLDEPTMLKAMAKYGKAVDHIRSMVMHLNQAAGKHLFEVEVSMDETQLPTSHAEHIYIASELHRLDVKWVSFAPRFVGRFEKGVDYIGNVQDFEADLAVHAAIARQLGPYKLSLHSGSDKFSIYPIFAQQTCGMAHLKTAGTSYLEALRTIATIDRKLMSEIYSFARDHFERDRHSYLISGQISRAPHPEDVENWPALLDQFDAREILHVTFGSVLTEKTGESCLFYDRMMEVLRVNRERYFEYLAKHFKAHLKPFCDF